MKNRPEKLRLDELSAERLWLMFFPHLTRNCGIALMQELFALHKAAPLRDSVPSVVKK